MAQIAACCGSAGEGLPPCGGLFCLEALGIEVQTINGWAIWFDASQRLHGTDLVTACARFFLTGLTQAKPPQTGYISCLMASIVALLFIHMFEMVSSL